MEATLWMPDGANVLSMSKHFLGRTGRLLGGGAFILLYYCLMIAYFAGGVPVFKGIVQGLLQLEMPDLIAYPLFTGLFGGIIYLGTRVTDRLNFILMVGLVISFVMLLGTGFGEVKSELLQRQNWGIMLLAAPTLFSAYGYHNIVPSLSTYLKRNERKLRWAIIIGTMIPLAVYSLWQWMIIGILTEGQLAETLANGQSITKPLAEAVSNNWVSAIAQYFSFFALVTSMLGVALSMVDFVGDGTRLPRERGWGRWTLVALVFLPPLLFAWSSPGLFFAALRYAGGFGEAILNGLFPVLMVWVGRYKYKLTSAYQLPGGRLTLSILLLVAVGIIGRECVHLFV